MALTATERVQAALAELTASLDALEEPSPVEALPLETLATRFGTMSFELGHLPGILVWKMAVHDRGRSGLGSARIDFYSSKVDVSLSSKANAFNDLDWPAFTVAVHDAVVEAMHSQPGWNAYRRLVIAALLVRHTRELTTAVRSAGIHGDWLSTLAVWDRIAHEPDTATARLAESLYLSREFPGTAQELFDVARAAAGTA